MKAEHRKELQTNSLADMLGRTVRNVRTGGGFPWFKFAVVMVVALGILFWYVRRTNKERNEAEAWARVYYNDDMSLAKLMELSPGTDQAQAAQAMRYFESVWILASQIGDERFRLEPRSQPLPVIVESMKMALAKMAEDLKDDATRAAEAKYHIAVCDEALAAYDSRYLDEAKRSFKELADGDMKSTAHGVLAKKRLAQYEDPAQFAVISSFYQDLQKRTKVERVSK